MALSRKSIDAIRSRGRSRQRRSRRRALQADLGSEQSSQGVALVDMPLSNPVAAEAMVVQETARQASTTLATPAPQPVDLSNNATVMQTCSNPAEFERIQQAALLQLLLQQSTSEFHVSTTFYDDPRVQFCKEISTPMISLDTEQPISERVASTVAEFQTQYNESVYLGDEPPPPEADVQQLLAEALEPLEVSANQSTTTQIAIARIPRQSEPIATMSGPANGFISMPDDYTFAGDIAVDTDPATTTAALSFGDIIVDD